ncbi:BTB/POZ domain-containing protein-like protein [Tanacetum coccineum]
MGIETLTPTREKAIQMLQFNLNKAQDRMKSQADKHRIEGNLQSMIGMNYSNFDTTSRLVQWRVDVPANLTPLKTPHFKIGESVWFLSLVKEQKLDITVVPISCDQGPPIVSFNMRLVSLEGGRRTLGRAEIRDKLLQLMETYTVRADVPLTRRFLTEVEFLDVKTASPEASGGEPPSLWSEGSAKDVTTTSAFGRMFSESIHTDITIVASDGSIGAHRAVLAAHSPVFDSMFTHDLMEKATSSINIPDMSIEVCRAFLSYLYCKNIRYQEFLTHRLDLLKVADMYVVTNLKDACQESLIEDIDSENVLERLQTASVYSLPRLKVCCIKYLVKFGKILNIRKEFSAFVQTADRELVSEVVDEIISAWIGV